ncbi:MAG TPA: hypothetical protein PK842_03925 [Smithella sp.]|jgi:hypothetical protein|nr:hypothetical protein [Smithella sp.]NLM66021.1 hypothetical protein [Enterococcus sp.]NMC97150.1 hypothetical protein [Deltaproteobacteria bacterium]OPZ52857.1 MAG: hypothetical protein BWY90_00928 [Deltaproteobacteria bacterium ADurb.BinA014]HNQ64876.1 hypothetical protein [Smithella sp.]
MKSDLTRQDWEEYLIRLYFGTKNDLIKSCINRAYRDFNRTLHGMDDHKNKQDLFDRAVKYLLSIFIDIKKESLNDHEEFDKWHKEKCLHLKNLYKENDFINFSIGQAQKWINMTFKYIFCVGEKRLPGYSGLYEFCHVPIDNIILDKIKKRGAPVPSKPWSRLGDYNEYISLQKWFREQYKLPLDGEFILWMEEPHDNVIMPVQNNIVLDKTRVKEAKDETIGPYQLNRIILCSADASPASQKKDKYKAEYFFPSAKWVGAVRNVASDLGCKFVILTTKHGLVNPSDDIDHYDLEIKGNENIINEKWQDTTSRLIRRGQYDILVFYAGGCPRDEYLRILSPILKNLEIDLLTFGKPNMGDAGKIKDIVESLGEEASIDTLKKKLKFPDRLLFFPHNNKA